MLCVHLKSPDPNLSLVWNGLCIYHSKVRLLMKSLRTLAGALLLSLRGRSSIGMPPFPTYFPPRLAPANQSPVRWTALAGDFLQTLAGRDSQANLTSNVSNKPGDLLNSRRIAAGTQLRESIE